MSACDCDCHAGDGALSGWRVGGLASERRDTSPKWRAVREAVDFALDSYPLDGTLSKSVYRAVAVAAARAAQRAYQFAYLDGQREALATTQRDIVNPLKAAFTGGPFAHVSNRTEEPP